MIRELTLNGTDFKLAAPRQSRLRHVAAVSKADNGLAGAYQIAVCIQSPKLTAMHPERNSITGVMGIRDLVDYAEEAFDEISMLLGNDVEDYIALMEASNEVVTGAQAVAKKK